MRKWLTICIMTLLMTPLAAHDNEESKDAQTTRIAISVSAEHKSVPDTAAITLRVVSEAQTAKEAMNKTSIAMQKIFQNLKDKSIEGKDLQTQNITLQPRYKYDNGTSKIIGYTAQNAITVTLKDMVLLSQLLDDSISLGANSVSGPHFFTQNDENNIAIAREKAVSALKARITFYENAFSLKFKRIVTLNENTHIPQPMPYARASMEMAADAMVKAAPPIAAGEDTTVINLNAQVEFEKQKP